MSGFAASSRGGSTKPTEQRRRDLLDRGKPAKPALWNDARVRPLRLDPVPVALRVPADLTTELSHSLAWRAAEPEERTKLRVSLSNLIQMTQPLGSFSRWRLTVTSWALPPRVLFSWTERRILSWPSMNS